MLCPHCGHDGPSLGGASGAICGKCRQPLRANASDDDPMLSSHSKETKVGRMRAPTPAELGAPDTLLRPDAVLGLRAPLPADASPFELHVAGLVDGVRPVARIRKRSGLSSSDLRIALGMLRDRKVLELVGIIEEAMGVWAKDIAADFAEVEVTAPQGSGEYIPPHVMKEIQSMLDEEERAKIAEALGDDDDDEPQKKNVPAFVDFDQQTAEMLPVPPDDDENR